MGEIKLDKDTMLYNIYELQGRLYDFSLTNYLSYGLGEDSPAMKRFAELYYAFGQLIFQYKLKLQDDLRFVNESLNLFAEQESNFAEYFRENPSATSPFEPLAGVSLDFGE